MLMGTKRPDARRPRNGYKRKNAALKHIWVVDIIFLFFVVSNRISEFAQSSLKSNEEFIFHLGASREHSFVYFIFCEAKECRLRFRNSALSWADGLEKCSLVATPHTRLWMSHPNGSQLPSPESCCRHWLSILLLFLERVRHRSYMWPNTCNCHKSVTNSHSCIAISSCFLDYPRTAKRIPVVSGRKKQ